MREASSQTQRHERVERGIYERETQDGTRYEFNYTGSDGKTHWETVSTLGQARKRRAAKIAALDRGEEVLPRKKTRFSEVAEEWYEAKKRRVRPRTAEYARRSLDLVLLPRFGDSYVTSIDASAIAKLISDLEREGLHALDPKRPIRPLGRSSIDNYLKPLNATMKLAVRRKLITSNPFNDLTSDDRPKAAKRDVHEWDESEVDALLAASATLAAKPESRYDYTLLLRLTARLGTRVGETLGLRWEDFDKDDGYLSVSRQWTRDGEYGPTKTAAGVRRLPLPADLREDLIAHRLRSEYSDDSDPIFASRIGTPLAHRNVLRRGFRPAADAVELTGVTLHDLRHAAASRLIDAGLDPVTVAAFMGHEDASVTLKIYAHRFNKQRKDDAVRLALEAAAAGH